MTSKQLSNNALFVVIIATIMLSVFATWITLNNVTPVTGAVTGTVNVTINSTTGISLVTSLVNFTEASPGESRSTYRTSDKYSGPFNLTNDGTVLVNVTISATSLFSSGTFSMPEYRYVYNVSVLPQYMGRAFFNCTTGLNTSGLTGYDLAGYRFVRTSSEMAICNLNYTDGADSVIVHINITIPSDETSGAKGSLVTFLASQAM